MKMENWCDTNYIAAVMDCIMRSAVKHFSIAPFVWPRVVGGEIRGAGRLAESRRSHFVARAE